MGDIFGNLMTAEMLSKGGFAFKVRFSALRTDERFLVLSFAMGHDFGPFRKGSQAAFVSAQIYFSGMSTFLMLSEARTCIKAERTSFALINGFTGMNGTNVLSQLIMFSKRFGTTFFGASKGSLIQVSFFVSLQMMLQCKSLLTIRKGALERSFSSVSRETMALQVTVS